MFWFVMLLIMLLVIGASVLVGVIMNKRAGRSPRQRRQLDMAKASGAFQHRKSNQ
jgi:uncharacterized SAM-binding protein YcdF (DUF218 family)